MESCSIPNYPAGERPDIQLCIFPHLKEFLVIDLREGSTGVQLLGAAEVFTEDFFKAVEEEFFRGRPDGNRVPFRPPHQPSLRMQEAVRETAMTFVLDRLGVGPHSEAIPKCHRVHRQRGCPGSPNGAGPGGAEATVAGQLRGKRRQRSGEEVLSRLISEENAVLQRLNQHELTEALHGDSPDYFTLWENRN